jgi:triacylglycerol lipase
MLPIVFIHGMGGGTYEYQPIIRILRENGFEKFYEFSYEEKFGELSLTELGKRFDKYVAANVAEKEFNIIALSQGGIIARYFIMINKKKTVKKCITLCTPHKGSLMAYLSRTPGFIDLRPSSDLLKSLENRNDKTKHYSVYNPIDISVFPGTNAILESASENKRIVSLLHHLTFRNQSTLKFILRVLTKD